MSGRQRSLALTAPDRARLAAGAAELGVALDDVAVDRFALYAQLLDRWRGSANLISSGDSAQLVERHLLDGLACVWPTAAARAVVDLGSGAGIPGVPVAIAHPERRVALVEPRLRRVSFLREVRRVLRLDALQVYAGRAEDGASAHGEPFDAAVTRAVWADDAAADLAAAWVRPGGLLLCLRSSTHRRDGRPSRNLFFETMLSYRVGGRRGRIDIFRKLG